MSRPQVGIDRLPVRRMSNEPKESMNCKSCRKRKIKCNRLRPACEACQVFACPCIYDAIPKKRGPKTDILDSLLKRVDGLEKRLKSEASSDAPAPENAPVPPQNIETEVAAAAKQVRKASKASSSSKEPQSTAKASSVSPVYPRSAPNLDSSENVLIVGSPTSPAIYPDVLLDTYFARIHGKPYYILDEPTIRQRSANNQLPAHLAFSIYALSARYAPNSGGYNAAVRLGQHYAESARAELDVDEPSIETLQALLLLSQVGFQNGRGKKAYMYLASASSMALALQLHREIPANTRVPASEREGRRRLFWACYLMDRFVACGSKRPSLISDESIILRLPSWQLHQGSVAVEGDYFPNGSNVQYMGGHGRPGQRGSAMLIGVVRILGVTNRYLAAGGVKGDSHFPWHSLSNLSKIRQDLDVWAAETQDVFTSLDSLFGQPDSTILVLSKLIYHLIHCLIYRPFLPVDLAELSGNSQHQSWQIESTNLCFLHANAIAELVEIGKAASLVDWPGFVGFCVCTAGTIHVHGAHYPSREGEVFSASAEYLAREMQQLSDFRLSWAGVQHQRDTLQQVFSCHAELAKQMVQNSMRFSPVFQLEDFFDRYPGPYFDGSHVTLNDIMVDAVHESLNYGHGIDGGRGVPPMPIASQQALLNAQQQFGNLHMPPNTRKRRRTQTQPQASPPLSATTAGTGDMFPMPHEIGRQGSLGSLPGDVFPNENGAVAPFSPIMEYNPADQVQQNPMETPMPEIDPMLSLPTPKDQPEGEGLDGQAREQPDQGQGQVQGQAQAQTQAQAAAAAAQQDGDKDPFLSLLQQLAENEQSRGGPSELDFFLSTT